MPAPKGSKNALGNKGGGRKSRYEEREAATIVKSIFAGEYKPKISWKAFETAVKSDKLAYGMSGWDVVAWKIYTGKSDKIIANLVDKLVPDKIDSQGLGDAYARIAMLPPAIKPNQDGYSS